MEDAAAATAAPAEAPEAPPAAVTAAALLEAMKAQREWAKALAFDAGGRVLAATTQPLEGEIEWENGQNHKKPKKIKELTRFYFSSWFSCSRALTKLFDKRDDTIAAGIVLLSEQYDVHR